MLDLKLSNIVPANLYKGLTLADLAGIVRLDPSNIPARRVRVLTNREGVERRRDFVQDVTAGPTTVRTPDGAPV